MAGPATRYTIPHTASSTVAEVDLSALRHNARILQAMAAPAKLMAVVKADAYGHGAGPVAAALAREGVGWFMVASLSEGFRLRDHGIASPILVAAPPHPAHLSFYRDHDFHVSAASTEAVEALLHEPRRGKPLVVHVKIDTGMNRLGLTPDEAMTAIPSLLEHPGLQVEGVWTHLATAAHHDHRFAIRQIHSARSVYAVYQERIPLFHAGNSSALLNLPAETIRRENELIRVGGSLLGISAVPDAAEKAGLQPVLTLKTRVLQVKTVRKGDSVSYGRSWIAPSDRRIATLGAGYADGYPGRLFGQAHVRIGAHTFPVVGQVCMDMLMVDLGGPDAEAGRIAPHDEAVLFGAAHPVLHHLAACSKKKAYEICCSIAERVPRIYMHR